MKLNYYPLRKNNKDNNVIITSVKKNNEIIALVRSGRAIISLFFFTEVIIPQCIDVMADHMESFKPDLRMLIEGKGKQVVHIKLGGEARKSQKV